MATLKSDKAAKKNPLMTRLRNNFMSGLLIATPIFITVYLVWWIVSAIDASVKPLFPKELELAPHFLIHHIPGLGIVVVLVGLTLLGSLGKNVVGKWFIRLGERVVARTPIARSIYSTTKQLAQTIMQRDSTAFRQVAMIEYPRKGLWSLCLVTSTTKGEVQRRTDGDLISVFVPTTPNPTSGFLIFVPHADIYPLEMSVDEGLKMIVSTGLVTPEDRGRTDWPEVPPTS